MTPDEQREVEMDEWHAALASGDEAWIDDAKNRILNGIHTRIMNDDPNYGTAGWTAPGGG